MPTPVSIQSAILRIGSHPLAGQTDHQVATALSARHQWSLAFALDAIEEYRKFMVLAASGPSLTPSVAVDEVWHWHLEHPTDYKGPWSAALGRCINHDPSESTTEARAVDEERYQATLELYATHFGVPPAHIWPKDQAAAIRWSKLNPWVGALSEEEAAYTLGGRARVVSWWWFVSCQTGILTFVSEGIWMVSASAINRLPNPGRGLLPRVWSDVPAPTTISFEKFCQMCTPVLETLEFRMTRQRLLHPEWMSDVAHVLFAIPVVVYVIMALLCAWLLSAWLILPIIAAVIIRSALPNQARHHRWPTATAQSHVNTHRRPAADVPYAAHPDTASHSVIWWGPSSLDGSSYDDWTPPKTSPSGAAACSSASLNEMSSSSGGFGSSSFETSGGFGGSSDSGSSSDGGSSSSCSSSSSCGSSGCGGGGD